MIKIWGARHSILKEKRYFYFLRRHCAQLSGIAIFLSVVPVAASPGQVTKSCDVEFATIVSADDHEITVKTYLPGCSFVPGACVGACPLIKLGTTVKFLINDSTQIQLFNELPLPRSEVTNYKSVKLLRFHQEGHNFVIDTLRLDDPKPEADAYLNKLRGRALDREVGASEHMANGLKLQKQGDLDGAITEYGLAISLSPTFAKPHNNLGYALLTKGDRAGAIREFRLALRLDPSYKSAHYNLANSLSDQGEAKEADQHYAAACPTFFSRFCPAPSAPAQREKTPLCNGLNWYCQGVTPDGRLPH